MQSSTLGDAFLRAGDCSYKLNKYMDAQVYYNEVINQKYTGFDYALYQKAILKGLQGNLLDKALALEELATKYPNSQYTDEALYQLGDTYQEMGKLEQAVPPLKRLVADFRGKSGLINQALLKLGLISYNQGNTSAAINYNKLVFANNPEAAEAKDALAALEEIYVKDLNRPDEYFAFLETVPSYKVLPDPKKPISSLGYMEYIVQRGDYLIAIARKFNVSERELATINGMEVNDALLVGKRLLIPRQ
ncbi:MAG: tetratricopeptide repeat protein [Saprospiraceae bacterium]